MEKLRPKIEEARPKPENERTPERKKRSKIDHPETVREREIEIEEKVESIRAKIESHEKESGQKSSEDKVADFQARYLPDHLKEQTNPTWLSRVMATVIGLKERLSGRKVEGRDNIPSGPFLLVSNHMGGETGPLLATFSDCNLHIAAGEATNWKRSNFRTWLLKKLGMLSVKETTSNLSSMEKKDLLNKVKGEKRIAAYREIIQREEDGALPPNNLPFVRAAIAALSRGDAVAMFPEGVFTYQKQRSLRQAYAGAEFIAQAYKKLTGQELPILPVGVSKKRISIGQPLSLEEKKGTLKAADWIMAHVARNLPEEERGYYADMSKNLGIE